MNESDVYDVSEHARYLLQLIALRNHAKRERGKGPLQDRSMWEEVYKHAIREIRKVEKQIGAYLPSGKYTRHMPFQKP